VGREAPAPRRWPPSSTIYRIPIFRQTLCGARKNYFSELEDKARRLAAYHQAASGEEIERIIRRVWMLPQQANLSDMLSS